LTPGDAAAALPLPHTHPTLRRKKTLNALRQRDGTSPLSVLAKYQQEQQLDKQEKWQEATEAAGRADREEEEEPAAGRPARARAGRSRAQLKKADRV
jgi:hypothetical protein